MTRQDSAREGGRRRVPVDRAKAASADISQVHWDRAADAHERFRELLETKPRAKARYDAVLGEIARRQVTLRHLREARALTQVALAEALGMEQSEVSRLERRADILLSTLQRFVRATGGELRVIVNYPDGGPAELSLPHD